jgi:nickel transport protein
MKKTFTALLVALPLAFAGSLPALAHKVVAGAYASGDHIEGEIGFSDGTMAKNQPIEVRSEDGTKIGETRTNEDGTFTFKPTKKMVYIFHADMGGGHIANIRMEAADLPVAFASDAAAPASAPATPNAPAEPAKAAAPAASATRMSESERDLLLQAVSNEIKPLRKEIIALKEKDSLQSILGGLGYIAGLFGLWFFLAARRRGSN